MSAKPRKVGEAKAAYAGKPPAKGIDQKPESTGVRQMDDATFKKVSAKVFKVHHELFRKLSQ